MNGLQAIQDRILSEAREQAEQISEQADARAAEILAEASALTEQQNASARQKAEAMAEALLARTRSTAVMESRKSLLQARQDLIEQAIAKASEIAGKLPEPQKVDFYRQLIEHSSISSGEVIFTAADRHLASRLLEASGQLALAGDNGAFGAGLILRRGLIEDNLSLDVLVTNMRSELVRLAAGIIFADESAN